MLQQTLTIEGHRVRVGNVLASGGFGFGAAVCHKACAHASCARQLTFAAPSVYHAKDETSLMLYALKVRAARLRAI